MAKCLTYKRFPKPIPMEDAKALVEIKVHLCSREVRTIAVPDSSTCSFFSLSLGMAALLLVRH